jgi:hypothetical protein
VSAGAFGVLLCFERHFVFVFLDTTLFRDFRISVDFDHFIGNAAHKIMERHRLFYQQQLALLDVTLCTCACTSASRTTTAQNHQESSP